MSRRLRKRQPIPMHLRFRDLAYKPIVAVTKLIFILFFWYSYAFKAV